MYFLYHFRMRHTLFSAVLIALIPYLVWAQSSLPSSITSATVLIANYNASGTFLGWGSGFFVDEGIVVTNKHVIESGDWYRVYGTGVNEAIDFNCYRKITKSDVKINLDDDVAYMRAYLPCDHGTMNFAADPQEGDLISVIGYPYKKGSTTIELVVSSGTVIGRTEDGWLSTDAYMDVGNSGGPVINGTEVVGVAVAKGIDDQGNFVEGYFIPSSTILRGLLYANNSDFGYTPQSSISSRSSSARSSSVSSSSSVFSSSSSQRSSSFSSRSSFVQTFPDVSPLREGYVAILSLRDRGVIGGYTDGTFRPDVGINRAEFLKILVAGFRGDEIRGETECFRDIADEWFAPYICAAKRLGWIDGYPDGTFRPAQRINRAEAMKIVVTAFGGSPSGSSERMPSDVRSGTWFYEYVAKGVAIGIVDPSVRFLPALDLTREKAAMWIYGADKDV